MEVSRGRRVLAWLLNYITFNGFFGIINLILLITKNTTVGGLVAGYKFEKKFGGIFLLGLTKILVGILYALTLTIFYWVDIATMGKRNGTFAESWSNCRKKNA